MCLSDYWGGRRCIVVVCYYMTRSEARLSGGFFFTLKARGTLGKGLRVLLCEGRGGLGFDRMVTPRDGVVSAAADDC